MKGIGKVLLVILGIGCFLYDLAEFLAVPAILVVIGLVNGFGWQYYAGSMAAYLAVWGLIELLAWLVGKLMEKLLGVSANRQPRLIRKLQSASRRFKDKHHN